jgi:hypothetical protein
MIQHWDYKTILCQTGGIGERFEVDGMPGAHPKAFVTLFKKLGRDGWELVAHSATIFPAPFENMTAEERASFPLLDESGQIHPLRQPGMIYWWIFKRPLLPAAGENASGLAESDIASSTHTTAKAVADAQELIRRYQTGEHDFAGSQLNGAKLTETSLTKIDLNGSDLSGADLSWANLTKANLSGADLSGANLAGTILARANLRNADLTGAMLIDAQLTGADLTDANLEGACAGEPELAGVASFKGTTMPDGTRYD